MLAPNDSLYKVHAEQKVKRFSSPFADLEALPVIPLFPNLDMTKQRHRQEQTSCPRSSPPSQHSRPQRLKPLRRLARRLTLYFLEVLYIFKKLFLLKLYTSTCRVRTDTEFVVVLSAALGNIICSYLVLWLPLNPQQHFTLKIEHDTPNCWS